MRISFLLATFAIAIAAIVASGLYTSQYPRLVVPQCREMIMSALASTEASSHQEYGGVLEIGNSGSAELRYAITASCACVRAAPASGSIPPGKSVHVHITTPAPEARAQSYALYVNTNDPRRRRARFGLLIGTHDPVSAAPSAVDFGTVLTGTTASRVVALSGADADPNALVVTCEDCDEAWLDYSLSHRKEQHACDLVVAVQPSCPAGAHSATVRVKVKSKDFSIDIPITAFVHAEVAALPGTVDYEPPGHFHPAIIFVRDYRMRDLGALVSHDLPVGVQVRELYSAIPYQRAFELSGRIKDLDKTELDARLHFEKCATPAVFSLRVRSGTIGDPLPPSAVGDHR